MSNETCRGRGRPKLVPDAAQRQIIVEKARLLFLRKGYANTTTDEIAAICRISKQTMYRLFHSKSDLLGAIVDAGRPQWLDLTISDDLPIQEALEQIFRIDITAEQDQDRLSLLRIALVDGHAYPELKEIMNKCGTIKTQITLATWLERQVSLGRIVLPCEELAAARILLDMVFGALVMQYLDINWPGPAERKTHTRNAIRIFLNGVDAHKQRRTEQMA